MAAEETLHACKKIMEERNMLFEEIDSLFLSLREDYRVSDKLT